MKDNKFDKDLNYDFNLESYFDEDLKYGGLETNNLEEDFAYFGIQEIKEYTSKEDDDLNQKIESDYHNTYYHGNGKYGTRTLRMSNKEWHELNK